MLVTVSTVKETVEGLERFVSRNLAGGVDHLVVFVDDADPDAMAWLAAHEHVTAIATDGSWWSGHRPGALNARQKVNANLARAVVVDEPEVTWLFHIDGDEVLRADRARLDALPPDAAVLHAEVLEAVSRVDWPDGEVTHFKSLLGPDDLVLLQLLGVIEKPVNEHHFHGHVKGKSGMRPAMDRWFTLHEVTDAAQQDLAPYDGVNSDAVSVLHYESWSGQEFVRKWTNILESGELPAMRGRRQPTAVAIRALLARDLPAEARSELLLRVYRATTEDDFETLRKLGMLTEIHPRAGGHVPQSLSEEARQRIAARLAGLAPQDKRVFRTGETARAATKALAAAGGAGSAGSQKVSWSARRPAWPSR